MEWVCGLAVGVLVLAVVGHLLWLGAAAIFNALFGTAELPRPVRPFRYCPACNADTDPRASKCPECGLPFDGRRARELHRVRVAEREVRALAEDTRIDRATADAVLEQLQHRACRLRRLPAKPGPRPRAAPVSPAPEPLPPVEFGEAAAPVSPPEPAAAVAAPAVAALTDANLAAPPPPAPEPETLAPEPPPRRRLAEFLEAHNIFWGELVGGLLIVGCSIALVVTLWRQLEEIRYFPAGLSFLVTVALFFAGQYTLHHWKLTGTSRGMLVITMLLTPLTLLLLSEPVAHGKGDAFDSGIKLAALLAFVGIVRTAGRDLIGTGYLPGPIDRRWLLVLAVIGAAATQLLPAALSSEWLPLACFVAACGATLGGLSWYRPVKREDPIGEKSGAALLVFVGLAAFALLSAWGLYLARVPDEIVPRLHRLAVPLALASVPVVEAGILVYRRVAGSAGLRTAGTGVALAGFATLTAGLALAWPKPLPVLLVSAAGGLFLTRVAFRERLAWVQVGAIPLLAHAAVVGFHGLAGNWAAPAGASESAWLGARLASAESGAVLVGFALALALLAEVLVRRASVQAMGYALGALGVGLVGLLLATGKGADDPALTAGAHLAAALGLLASNYRWRRRALASAGLMLLVVAALWALWWQVPGQPDRWGHVIGLEAFLLAFGAVALRRVRDTGTALLRRAARDSAFACCIVAATLAVTYGTLKSEWHTGTLFSLSFTAFLLARLTGWPALTWASSVAALAGFVHLTVYTYKWERVALAVEAGILTHATFATLAAVICRRQARVFGYPLRWTSRLSSVLAVPLLLLPGLGLGFVWAGFAVWLGALWLTFVLLWKERGGFSAFQGALTLAALLTAFGWVERQPWWGASPLGLRDPRALHAFGLALAALAYAWVIARRSLRGSYRARDLWCDNPFSVERIVLAATVAAFVFLTAVAVVPGVRAELTPLGWSLPIVAPAELVHASDPTAWLLLALLAGAVLLSWRFSRFALDTDAHAVGLMLLFLAAPVVFAGSHGVEVATASALRWGLAVTFVLGSAALALRVPIRRAVLATGFPVEPSPALRPWLYALLALAAGVVIVLSGTVAQIGLSRLKPSGPAEVSVFALMGAMASNLVPLALVVLGLGGTAARERSGGYALSGGLVFVATATAGYALSVVTAGLPLDGTEQVRLMLVAAGAAAGWALLWLAGEWRVPGGIPLTLQVWLGFATLALVCLVPTVQLLVTPSEPLPAWVVPLGHYGWSVLALVACAGFWHARRAWGEGVWLVFAYAGVGAGVLVAATLHELDAPGLWLSFHAMALTWAAAGFAFLAVVNRGVVGRVCLTAFAGLLVLCALRAGWESPWRPWLPAGLALASALFLGAVAVRTRMQGFGAASGAAITLAAVLVWVAWGPHTGSGFVLTVACGLAATAACWTLVRLRLRAAGEDAEWLQFPDITIIAALGCLLLGLASTLSGNRADPPGLTWGATGAVVLACVVGLWDSAARFARPGLFTVGALAVLLGVVQADPMPAWKAPAAPLALAAYALGVAWLALEASRRTKPLFGMPERRDPWVWLLVGQSLVAAAVVALGVRTSLFPPSIWERLVAPMGIALLALAAGVMARAVPEVTRGALRTSVVVLGVLAVCALAWAVPDPAERFAWLHRNAWLFVALVAAAVVGSGAAPRLGENWRLAVRGVAGWSAVAAFVVLCVHLLQQIPAYDPRPEVRRTPLYRGEAVAMLAAIAALAVLLVRFALKPDRDPFALSTRGRTSYVYGAEVLVVLFFTQIRFNLPELFLKELATVWTFAVMVLAYIGIGLAEFFERRKVEVLARPLRRTGVLLPIVPLLAFWAKPPAFLGEFAREQAPGLGPLLGYLERLPQHFDMYAWLWVLAGGVYGLVALFRKSFGWALLAALATNAAVWSLLAHTGVPFIVHPQAWVIPLALIVLVSEHVNRHRLSEEASNAMRYAGVSMIYVASAADMFLAGVGQSVWLPVVLAVLCVLGVLAGILLRVRAFIFLGVGFLLLDVFSMIWHAAVNLQQTWVWYASGIVLGVAVLALFAYLEKRRTHAKEEGS